MPVCVHCAYPAKHLYTTYSSESNVRLDVCPRCQQFLDPLIEHPATILLLDLVLLKPRVYLHLMFNRGSVPDKRGSSAAVPQEELQLEHPNDIGLWWDLVRLAVLYVAAETCVRQMTMHDGLSATKDAVLVSLELLAQHIATLAAATLPLMYRGWLRWPGTLAVVDPPKPIDAHVTKDTKGDLAKKDGRKENFSLILINLTLLFTSLLPLLLHLIISIWSAAEEGVNVDRLSDPLTNVFPQTILRILPPVVLDPMTEASRILVQSEGDKIWIMTRLLGGMSAGFGLRVLLPTTPLETTTIVLAGWIAAAGIGRLVSSALMYV